MSDVAELRRELAELEAKISRIRIRYFNRMEPPQPGDPFFERWQKIDSYERQLTQYALTLYTRLRRRKGPSIPVAQPERRRRNDKPKERKVQGRRVVPGKLF